MVEQDRSQACAALAHFVARRRPGQTALGITLHVERLIARKTCPACWCPMGVGMHAHLGSTAHAIGCEALATIAAHAPVHLRVDPRLALLLRAARG